MQHVMCQIRVSDSHNWRWFLHVHISARSYDILVHHFPLFGKITPKWMNHKNDLLKIPFHVCFIDHSFQSNTHTIAGFCPNPLPPPDTQTTRLPGCSLLYVKYVNNASMWQLVWSTIWHWEGYQIICVFMYGLTLVKEGLFPYGTQTNFMVSRNVVKIMC